MGSCIGIMNTHRAPIVEDPEIDLVARAQQSDNAAFDELMRRTGRSSLRIATSILRNHHIAEEEVQNAYLNAWRHLDRFEAKSRFSTWISRIVVNQCLMRLRLLRLGSTVSLDAASDRDETTNLREAVDNRATPEGRFSGNEELMALQREIRRLPPSLRCVLVLRDINELTTQDAAETLGISSAAVKSRLLRARVELRYRLRNVVNLSASAADS